MTNYQRLLVGLLLTVMLVLSVVVGLALLDFIYEHSYWEPQQR